MTRRLRPPILLAALLTAAIAAGIFAARRSHRAPTATPLEAVRAAATSRGPAVATVGAPAVPASERPTPARMFRGGPRHLHRSAFAGPREARVLFTFDAGGPVEAMPAVVEDGGVVVASLSGRVARLSAAGLPKWTVELGERVYASPLIAGSSIIVGSDAKRLVALSLATGKTRWSLDVDGEADTSPAEGPDGLVIVAAGRVLYGLREDGRIAWRFSAKRKIYASPAIAEDGTSYVGSQDGHLYAVSRTGSLVFRAPLGADVDCAASIGDDGTIYVGDDAGEVVALGQDGGVRWRTAVGGFVRGGLSITRAGLVLAGTYGPSPRVVALDPRSGVETWSFAVRGSGAPELGIHGAPLEDAAGNLYFGAQDDDVYALDASGKLLFRFHTGGDVDAPLVLGPAPDEPPDSGAGLLLVGSDDGRLYGLR